MVNYSCRAKTRSRLWPTGCFEVIRILISELQFIILWSMLLNLCSSFSSVKSTSYRTIRIYIVFSRSITDFRLISKSCSTFVASLIFEVSSANFYTSIATFWLNLSSICIIPFLNALLSSRRRATLLVISFLPMPALPLTVTSRFSLIFLIILCISWFL